MSGSTQERGDSKEEESFREWGGGRKEYIAREKTKDERGRTGNPSQDERSGGRKSPEKKKSRGRYMIMNLSLTQHLQLKSIWTATAVWEWKHAGERRFKGRGEFSRMRGRKKRIYCWRKDKRWKRPYRKPVTRWQKWWKKKSRGRYMIMNLKEVKKWRFWEKPSRTLF